jgi:hypothetical protein
LFLNAAQIDTIGGKIRDFPKDASQCLPFMKSATASIFTTIPFFLRRAISDKSLSVLLAAAAETWPQNKRNLAHHFVANTNG